VIYNLAPLLSFAGGIIVGSLGVFASFRASDKAMHSTERQLEFNRAAKIADFRQQWISELRETMAKWRSFGIFPAEGETPTEREAIAQEINRLRTKSFLLMNRRDARYTKLHGMMTSVSYAMAYADRGSGDDPFVELFQDILKTEWETLKADLGKAGGPIGGKQPN
jgi:hypothetical protein